MKDAITFKTQQLTGGPPALADIGLYVRVFGASGHRELHRNLQDFSRHHVAPWTLHYDNTSVGVGGFRIGFGETEGIELTLALLPDLPTVGLAGAFLEDALVIAQNSLRADRVFSHVDGETTLSLRMLRDAGFEDAGPAPIPGRPDRRLMRLQTASHAEAWQMRRSE